MLLPPANEVCEGYIFTCVCPRGGGVVSQHALQVSKGCVSQHALQVVSHHALQVSRGVYPSMPCRFPGPHPRGSLRGLAGGGVSRPTLMGGLQVYTWGGFSRHTWGGSPGPHPGGFQAHMGSVSQHAQRQNPPGWRPLLWAVRILLECILVNKFVV